MRVYRAISLAIVYFLFISALSAQEPNNLEKKLNDIGTDFALLIHSQGIDDYPVWSRDSNLIVINLLSKWYKIDLNAIEFEKGEWRNGQLIAVSKYKNGLAELTEKEVREFKKLSRPPRRKVMTKSGVRIELRQRDLGTSFEIKRGLGKTKICWATDFENCHSLVLSPNERYVAFICELNGLILMKLNNSGCKSGNSRGNSGDSVR